MVIFGIIKRLYLHNMAKPGGENADRDDFRAREEDLHREASVHLPEDPDWEGGDRPNPVGDAVMKKNELFEETKDLREKDADQVGTRVTRDPRERENEIRIDAGSDSEDADSPPEAGVDGSDTDDESVDPAAAAAGLADAVNASSNGLADAVEGGASGAKDAVDDLTGRLGIDDDTPFVGEQVKGFKGFINRILNTARTAKDGETIKIREDDPWWMKFTVGLAAPLMPIFRWIAGWFGSDKPGSSGGSSAPEGPGRAIAGSEGVAKIPDDIPETKPVFVDGMSITPAFGIQGQTRVSSVYEKRRLRGATETRFHRGLDLGAAMGTPIVAKQKLRVVLRPIKEHFITNENGKRVKNPSGNAIVVQDADGNYNTLCHAQNNITWKKGDIINPGEIIMEVGSSGRSTGPHLHWAFSKTGPNIADMTDPAEVVNNDAVLGHIKYKRRIQLQNVPDHDHDHGEEETAVASSGDEKPEEDGLPENWGDLVSKNKVESGTMEFAHAGKDVKINIDDMTIQYAGRTAELDLPMGASLDSVQAKEDGSFDITASQLMMEKTVTLTYAKMSEYLKKFEDDEVKRIDIGDDAELVFV